MTSEERLLHARSLNFLRPLHTPTYVGARLLAEIGTRQTAEQPGQGEGRRVYWEHAIFRSLGGDREPAYRRVVIGSPRTNLEEVRLLARLARERAFASPPCVYSHLWGHGGSTHVFRNYYRGYAERERRIALAAAGMRRSRVVVLDLRNFYPSIEVSRARGRFAGRVGLSTLSSSERSAAVRCVEGLTSRGGVPGLPVGPPLSHVLANVFLEELDRRLREATGDRYYRYVDDVAMVVPRGGEGRARRLFERVAGDEGLEVNPEKTDVVTDEAWAAHVRGRERGEAEDFDMLLGDLRRHLAHNPGDHRRVRDLFRAGGFALPFARLRAVASSGSFRRLLRTRSGGTSGWDLPGPEELLRRAMRLRRIFGARLRESLDRPLPAGGMARRWGIQGLRFLLNRALYLLPERERASVLAMLPDCAELQPWRVVLAALVSGDAGELTRYPGPTVSAFCELWEESGAGRPHLAWSPAPTPAERDAVGVLALRGLASPPKAWTGRLPDRGSRILIDLSAGRRIARGHLENHPYLDEMVSLFRRSGADVTRILATRFDEGEDVDLPTLSLGGAY